MLQWEVCLRAWGQVTSEQLNRNKVSLRERLQNSRPKKLLALDGGIRPAGRTGSIWGRNRLSAPCVAGRARPRRRDVQSRAAVTAKQSAQGGRGILAAVPCT